MDKHNTPDMDYDGMGDFSRFPEPQPKHSRDKVSDMYWCFNIACWCCIILTIIILLSL